MPADLRIAWRNLTRSPRFAFVAVLSMALGIAAATSIFSFVYGILLAPLPFSGSDRLISIQETDRGRNATGNPVRVFDWLQAPSIQSVTAWYGENMNLKVGPVPERVNGIRTFGDFLGTLNVQPTQGRTFTQQEYSGLGGNVCVISHSLWRNRFQSAPSTIGRGIQLNGEAWTIIGVLPASAQFEDAELIAPDINPKYSRSARFLAQFARLRPGTTLEQANTELVTVADRLRKQYPDTDASTAATVTSLRDHFVKPARTPLLVLLGAVGFVLLMACLNVASLSLSRTAGRSQELAIREALGAGRGRILRLLLCESSLIAGAGGLLSLIGTYWALDFLIARAPQDLPRLAEVRVEPAVLAFAALLTAMAAMLTGLIPAWRFSGSQLAEPLRSGGRNRVSRHHGVQKALAVTQIAVSLGLLTAGGLLFRTLWNLDSKPLGFAPERILTFRLSLPWQTEPADVARLYTRVLDRLRQVPGVSAVALTDRLPFDGTPMEADVLIAGRPQVELPPGSRLGMRVVSPNFHDTLRVPLIAGRSLSVADLAPGARRAVINQETARRYFAGRDPIGARIGLKWSRKAPRPEDFYEIVGVTGDLPTSTREKTPEPAMYVSYTQEFWPLAQFLIRTRTNPESLSGVVREEVAKVDSSQAIESMRTLEGVLQTRNQTPRLQAWMVALFGASSLLLAALGVYGVIASLVADRQFEIGVRMALGAEPGSVLRHFLLSAMKLTLAGAITGLAVAVAFTRAIQSVLYGVAPTDPGTAATALGLLIVVVAASAWWPARRAALTNPAVVLRGRD